MRKLLKEEIDLIKAIAARCPAEQKAGIEGDLKVMHVEEGGIKDGRILFGIAEYARPAYTGQKKIPVEGRILDVDGSEITIILYTDARDRLLELELIKWGSEQNISPLWSSLSLY